MRAYLLDSGRTLKAYWGEMTLPKCLIPIKGDNTILDYQVDRFSKLGIKMTIVLGYEKNAIITHCRERGYNVGFLEDKGWMEAYSIPRTLLDIEGALCGETDYTILVHGDLLFNIDMLKALVECDGQACMIQGKHMIFKLSSAALKHMLNILKYHPELDGLNTPLWRLVEEKYHVAEINPFFWYEDIDRHHDLNRLAVGRLDDI
jgi:hypothetical protein